MIRSFQADLFSGPILAGFAATPDIVTADREVPLVALIDASNLTPFRFQGWLGKRLTASF